MEVPDPADPMVGPTLPGGGSRAAQPAGLWSVRQPLGVGTGLPGPSSGRVPSRRAALPLAPRCERIRGSSDAPAMDDLGRSRSSRCRDARSPPGATLPSSLIGRARAWLLPRYVGGSAATELASARDDEQQHRTTVLLRRRTQHYAACCPRSQQGVWTCHGPDPVCTPRLRPARRRVRRGELRSACAGGRPPRQTRLLVRGQYRIRVHRTRACR